MSGPLPALGPKSPKPVSFRGSASYNKPPLKQSEGASPPATSAGRGSGRGMGLGMVANYGADIEMLRTEIANMKESHAKEITSLREEINQLQEGKKVEAEIMSIKQETQTHKMSALESEVDALKQEIAKLRESARRSRSGGGGDTEVLEADLMLLKDRVQSLKEEIVDKSASELELSAAMENLREDVTDLKEGDDVDTVREEIEVMQKEWDEKMQKELAAMREKFEKDMDALRRGMASGVGGKNNDPEFIEGEDLLVDEAIEEEEEDGGIPIMRDSLREHISVEDEEEFVEEGEEAAAAAVADSCIELTEWLEDFGLEHLRPVLIEFGIVSCDQLKKQYQSDEPSDIEFLREDFQDSVEEIDIKALWDAINGYY